MSKASSVFEFNTFELPRRAGEMKEYQLDLEILEPIGVPLVSVPAGDVIELDLRLESVTEGVLLSADLYAIAKGECTRCLDPVEITVERKIQELYRYEPSKDSGKKGRKSKRASDDDVDLEEDDELWMDGNVMDLSTYSGCSCLRSTDQPTLLRRVPWALSRLWSEVGRSAGRPQTRGGRRSLGGPGRTGF